MTNERKQQLKQIELKEIERISAINFTFDINDYEFMLDASVNKLNHDLLQNKTKSIYDSDNDGYFHKLTCNINELPSDPFHKLIWLTNREKYQKAWDKRKKQDNNEILNANEILSQMSFTFTLK